jgi:DNA-binding NtrC family response regulator
MKVLETLPTGPSRLNVRTVRVEALDGATNGPRSVEGETLTVGSAPGNDLQISDPTVSRFHLELAAAAGGVLLMDRGSTNGTRMGAARIERAVVPPGTKLLLGHTTIMVSEGKGAVVEIPEVNVLGGMAGGATVMRRLFGQIEQLARSNVAVLIQGESGTGKELVARALHELGPRTSGPLVTVDCGALTPALVASELFGHEAGAFTGAHKRHIGAFERANGGTVFFDEVGELPPVLQTTLLGVIERKRFRRVGGSSDIATDVRIVSATNRDLRTEVNAGLFRLDLFYRLGVVVLAVPPLRERREDLPILIDHFLRECGHQGAASEVFLPEMMEQLKHHSWPGNVRELRNLVEATLATGETPALEASPSQEESDADPLSAALDLDYKKARGLVLSEFEARYLRHILSRAGGNVARTAREAKMDRSHLLDLLRRHGLRPSDN